MKSKFLLGVICSTLFSGLLYAQSYTPTPQTDIKKSNMKQIFIDKFLVPGNAKQEFTERMKTNRNFIKNLSGFVEDAVYERTDERGDWTYITIAIWENEEALKKAKEEVQAEYKREGFNPAEMLERLNITMERGIYEQMLP